MRRCVAPSLILLTLLFSCNHGQLHSSRTPQPTLLVILHTNDTHGYIWGTDETGSAAQRGHVISSVRSEVEGSGGAVLVLDAGDVRTGTYCSDRQQSVPDLEAMEAMGYDAMVVGNHEFDLSYSTILEQRSLVDFPILGANVLSTETGEPILMPTATIERSGLRLAIIGLVTAESATTSTTGADPSIRFVDPTGVAREYVSRLRERNDVVIVLSHLGLEEDRRLAQAVQGIDVIVGGHSHDEVQEPLLVGSTVIVQAGNYGDYVGRVDLRISEGEVALIEGGLIPVTPDLPANEAVEEVLQSFACHEASEVVIELPHAITRDPLDGPGTSSALSNLVSDAMRSEAQTDLAMMNRGGIRADLPDGAVTAADIHAVLPFDNRLVVLEASGEDLVAIARSVHSRGADGRGVLFPSGMRFVFGPGQNVAVFIDGSPVDPSRRYTMALSSFIADGGDRHEAIRRLPRIRELSRTSSQVFTDYLSSQQQIQVDTESRTTWTTDAATPSSLKSAHRRRVGEGLADFSQFSWASSVF